jgi:hypothetical protein
MTLATAFHRPHNYLPANRQYLAERPEHGAVLTLPMRPISKTTGDRLLRALLRLVARARRRVTGAAAFGGCRASLVRSSLAAIAPKAASLRLSLARTTIRDPTVIATAVRCIATASTPTPQTIRANHLHLLLGHARLFQRLKSSRSSTKITQTLRDMGRLQSETY